MLSVFFHGALKKEFGEQFKLDVKSPIEAIRALLYQLPRFRAVLSSGYYKVISNKKCLSKDELSFSVQDDIHIVPTMQGSGGKGMIYAGAALLIIASYGAYTAPALSAAGAASTAGGATASGFAATSSIGITYGTMATIGVSLISGGISQLMAVMPKTAKQQGQPDENASSLLGGPQSGTNQGRPVPLIYGTMKVQGLAVQSAILPEDY